MNNVIIVQSPTEAAQHAADALTRAFVGLPDLTQPTVFAIGGDGTMLRAIRAELAANGYPLPAAYAHRIGDIVVQIAVADEVIY